MRTNGSRRVLAAMLVLAFGLGAQGPGQRALALPAPGSDWPAQWTAGTVDGPTDPVPTDTDTPTPTSTPEPVATDTPTSTPFPSATATRPTPTPTATGCCETPVCSRKQPTAEELTVADGEPVTLTVHSEQPHVCRIGGVHWYVDHVFQVKHWAVGCIVNDSYTVVAHWPNDLLVQAFVEANSGGSGVGCRVQWILHPLPPPTATPTPTDTPTDTPTPTGTPTSTPTPTNTPACFNLRGYARINGQGAPLGTTVQAWSGGGRAGSAVTTDVDGSYRMQICCTGSQQFTFQLTPPGGGPCWANENWACASGVPWLNLNGSPATATPTVTSTSTATLTPQPTVTPSPTLTATLTPQPTVTPSPTLTATVTPAPSPTATPEEPTPTPTTAYSLPPGSADLCVTDADIWTDPVTVYVDGAVTVGVNVHNKGAQAASNVEVHFAIAGCLLADSTVIIPEIGPYGLASVAVTPGWAPGCAGGPVHVAVRVDPAGGVEDVDRGNNGARRSVLVHPAPPGDVTPPSGTIRIGDGAAQTGQLAQVLHPLADDDPSGSGVTRMYIAEYGVDAGAHQWRVVASSGWVAYDTSYGWTLHGDGGASYIAAWFADAAGNVSATAAQAVINYLPEAGQAISADGWRLYLWDLAAGQRLTVSLETLNGDADLYVWQPGNVGAPDWYSAHDGQAEDEVSFTAAVQGQYQVVVYGAVDTQYALQVTMGGSAHGAGQMASKLVPSAPFVTGNPPSQAPMADPGIWGLWLPWVR